MSANMPDELKGDFLDVPLFRKWSVRAWAVAAFILILAGFYYWWALAITPLVLVGLLAPDRIWPRLLAPFRPVRLAALNPSRQIRDQSLS